MWRLASTHESAIRAVDKIHKTKNVLLCWLSLVHSNFCTRRVRYKWMLLKHTIEALHGFWARERWSLALLISFWRNFCFSAFLRWPVFFLGMLISTALLDGKFTKKLIWCEEKLNYSSRMPADCPWSGEDHFHRIQNMELYN